MNKAITDGVLLMPPAFAEGLQVWSRGDGTPGTDTYATATNGVFVPADQDFGGCLELLKTENPQHLRYMGETPLLPGCYLKVSARVKAISGNLPSVRIAGYPGRAGGAKVNGVTEFGPITTLTSYGEVIEVSAIVGAGNRDGVDMVWGPQALYGHFGLDLLGQNGGLVRVDDIRIEDVTSVFLRDMLAMVDVRDFGAVGDGSTDDTAAFEAANAASEGRTVLIPEGIFRLNGDVTFDAPTRFEGTVTMPTGAVLLLRQNFDFPHYMDAFDNEETAFKKGFQALLHNSDHEAFDLGGRKIAIDGPIDMNAVVPGKSSYATRRVIRNGQLLASDTNNWNSDTVTSQATYDSGDPRRLSNVGNVANIEVGALVTGAGVGREIYVRSKNVATQTVTLNAPLYDADGTQMFTFTRFKYMLDFIGFNQLSKFIISDVEFQCEGRASAINLAPAGVTFQLQDCFISRPRDRGVTSTGGGCQGMMIDRCNFLSNEDPLNVPQRSSIALNTNANDVKIRDNRATRFKHFAVITGGNTIFTGNHFFQGDSVAGGVRSAGLVIANPHCSTVISNNYIDNCTIEWTNEQDPRPAFTSGYSFSSLDISSNIFLTGDVAPWFTYIVVRPYGAGHFINGLNVSGNRFRTLNGSINRVERIDTSFADMDYSRMKNITFAANSFHGIETPVSNPHRFTYIENSPSQTWVMYLNDLLPFDAHAQKVDSIVAEGAIRNNNNVAVFTMPYAKVEEGPQQNQVHLVWSTAVKGKVQMTVRMDNDL